MAMNYAVFEVVWVYINTHVEQSTVHETCIHILSLLQHFNGVSQVKNYLRFFTLLTISLTEVISREMLQHRSLGKHDWTVHCADLWYGPSTQTMDRFVTVCCQSGEHSWLHVHCPPKSWAESLKRIYIYHTWPWLQPLCITSVSGLPWILSVMVCSWDGWQCTVEFLIIRTPY